MFAEANKTIETIAKLLPNYNMNIMLARLFKGEVFLVNQAMAWL